MYRPPPLRGQPVLEGKTVLLIDPNQPTRDVRVRVLQNHGVEVHAAADLSGARFLWQPHVYDLILLDVRRHLPGEALEFTSRSRAQVLRNASPSLWDHRSISRERGLAKSPRLMPRKDSGKRPSGDS
jgi:PleD family two-component response regulator